MLLIPRNVDFLSAGEEFGAGALKDALGGQKLADIASGATSATVPCNGTKRPGLLNVQSGLLRAPFERYLDVPGDCF
jgi:hypothetical protein